MRYEVIICRQESFEIEAENEEEAKDIALENAGLTGLDTTVEPHILEYNPEEITKVITNEV